MDDSAFARGLSNGNDINDVPEARQRLGNPFWDWCGGLLGLPGERYEPVNNDGVSREIATIRAYEQRRAAANVTLGDVVGQAATELVDGVKEVAAKVRRTPALKCAVEFLSRVLDAGPVSEKEVARLAQLEGLSAKTLKRARAKLKVKATKKGQRGGWFLSMTRAKEGQ